MRIKRTYVNPRAPRTPERVATERAARGARLLDAEAPGWADVIDLDALDVGEMEVAEAGDLAAMGGCVLCQVDLAITTGKETSEGCRIPRPGETAEDVLSEFEFYQAQKKKLDGADREHADDEGQRYEGSYVRLAKDLGLVTPEAKAEHGFLNDGQTTYPALDAAWTAEIEARRAGVSS